MLELAQFVDVSEVDVTPEYLRVHRMTVEARERYATELRTPGHEEEFDSERHRQKKHLAAIEDGLLRRSLFTAARPA